MRDGCGATDDSAPPLDLESSISGAETTVRKWTNCRGGRVELWTIHSGDHIPNLTSEFATDVYRFLSGK
jgi:hypothetical protein